MAKQSKVKGSAKKSVVSALESPAVKEVGLKRNLGTGNVNALKILMTNH